MQIFDVPCLENPGSTCECGNNVYTDGSWVNTTKQYLGLGGAGVWWPNRWSSKSTKPSNAYIVNINARRPNGNVAAVRPGMCAMITGDSIVRGTGCESILVPRLSLNDHLLRRY